MIFVTPGFVTLISVVVDAQAITLWPFIFAYSPLHPVTENHERIHLAQQVELLLIGFYFLYAYDYLRNRLEGKSSEEAYFGIRFEREAYAQQESLGYLETRPRFAWRDYPRG